MTKYKKVKKDKVNFRGQLKSTIELPKEKHLKYIPLIRSHFNLNDNYVILKDYQIYKEPKGNWLVMKNNKICFVLFGEYIKELFKEEVSCE